MKDIVRGVSIHSTSTGLQYYVHYDRIGTKEVNHHEYEEAVVTLNHWKIKIEKKEKQKENIVTY